ALEESPTQARKPEAASGAGERAQDADRGAQRRALRLDPLLEGLGELVVEEGDGDHDRAARVSRVVYDDPAHDLLDYGDRGADGQGRNESAGRGIGVVQGEDAHEDVLLGYGQGMDRRVEIGDDPRMAEDDAFGRARGPRREDDRGVRVGRDGLGRGKAGTAGEGGDPGPGLRGRRRRALLRRILPGRFVEPYRDRGACDSGEELAEAGREAAARN